MLDDMECACCLQGMCLLFTGHALGYRRSMRWKMEGMVGCVGTAETRIAAWCQP